MDRIDVIIDTDAYNETDDQFAISYLLKNDDRLNTVAIYAAPFHNNKSSGPADGMEKSYNEIIKLLGLLDRNDFASNVFRGSTEFLKDETTAVTSEAAVDLVQRAMKYSPEKKLTIVAIGAITNIASAIIMKPEIAERISVVWLGGNARHFHDTIEFNMMQDYSAARVVMSKASEFVQLPCAGVVSEFKISKQELEYYFLGKNPLADYLASYSIEESEGYSKGKNWTRTIWDVTAVAYLLNDKNFMMVSDTLTYLPDYTGHYEKNPIDKQMKYVYFINRDRLMNDLINKLTK